MKALHSKTASAQAAALAQKFHHNDFEWISSSDRTVPNWKTRTDRSLSLGELVREYLDIEQLIGVGFGTTTKYAMLDLDWNSKYHPTSNIEAYRQLLQTLEKIGITRYIVIQSSHSRGLHIYLPLPKPVHTFKLAAAIRITLTTAGYEIKNGQLEIFPNCKRYAKEAGDYSHYKAHRMPLQPNSSSWLMEDDGLDPQPIFDTVAAQITAFLNQWEWVAQGQDMELLDQKLPELYQKFKISKHKYQDRLEEWRSEEAQKWQTDLELILKIGWTAFGMTQILLPKFLAYAVVFLKLEGQELYDWMYQAIVNTPGYRQYCRHQHEIHKLIAGWIKTNERTGYYSAYRSYPDRSQPFPFGKKRKAKIVKKTNIANIRRADEAESRIQTAYDILKHEFTAETKITEMRDLLRAKIQEMYGIGIGTDTLTRHKKIWHPEHNIGKNTSPNQKSERCPETLLEEDSSENLKPPAISPENAQTDTDIKSDYSQSSMICGAERPKLERDNSHLPSISTQPHSLENELVPEAECKELSAYTKHYNLPTQEVVTRHPGKIEVLGGTLAKIAAVAALVVNMVAAVGVIQPEPSIAVEPVSNPTTPQVPETNPIEDLQTHPTPAGAQVNSGVDRSTAPISSIIPPAHNTQTVESETSPKVDRQEQTAPIPPPNQPPSEQIANNSEALQVRPQVVRLEHVREPSSISTPPNPIVKDNAQECDCPNCELPTPASELERWSMCRFCATKILFKRTI